LAKIDDEKEAEEILIWLKNLINETYELRNRIETNFSKGAELKALDIYKLLPGTNCKKCGELTCLAFAVKLVGQEIEIKKCIPLFSDEFKGKRKVLLDLIHAAGYEVPEDIQKKIEDPNYEKDIKDLKELQDIDWAKEKNARLGR